VSWSDGQGNSDGFTGQLSPQGANGTYQRSPKGCTWTWNFIMTFTS
jgi:hypothetical protein